jgi:hypothetical protein
MHSRLSVQELLALETEARQFYRRQEFGEAVERYDAARKSLEAWMDSGDLDSAAQLDVLTKHWFVWYELAQSCAERGRLHAFWKEGDAATLDRDWIQRADLCLDEYCRRLWPFVSLPLEEGIILVPLKDHPRLIALNALAYPLRLAADLKAMLGSYRAAVARYRSAAAIFKELGAGPETLHQTYTGLGYALACLGRKVEAASHLRWVREQTAGPWGGVCEAMLGALNVQVDQPS